MFCVTLYPLSKIINYLFCVTLYPFHFLFCVTLLHLPQIFCTKSPFQNPNWQELFLLIYDFCVCYHFIKLRITIWKFTWPLTLNIYSVWMCRHCSRFIALNPFYQKSTVTAIDFVHLWVVCVLSTYKTEFCYLIFYLTSHWIFI